MARYILLGKFSLNGVKGVINSSADRASVAKKSGRGRWWKVCLL